MARGTQNLSATRPHPMGMSMDEHWSLSFLWEPTRGSWGLDSLTWAHHTSQAVSPSLAQYFGFVYEGNAVSVAAPGAVTRYTSPKSIPFSEMNGALFRPHNIIIIPQQLLPSHFPHGDQPFWARLCSGTAPGSGGSPPGARSRRRGRFAAPGSPPAFPTRLLSTKIGRKKPSRGTIIKEWVVWNKEIPYF